MLAFEINGNNLKVKMLLDNISICQDHQTLVFIYTYWTQQKTSKENIVGHFGSNNPLVGRKRIHMYHVLKLGSNFYTHESKA
jgi:hypothetical protein